MNEDLNKEGNDQKNINRLIDLAQRYMNLHDASLDEALLMLNISEEDEEALRDHFEGGSSKR